MEQQEIFSLELNEEGVHWLRRFQSLAMVVLVATIFYNAMYLYNTLPYIFEANSNPDIPSKWRLGNTMSIIHMVIHAILQVAHVFFYYQFAVFSRRALAEQNSGELNQSFRWLYLQAVTLLAQVCFSLAYFLFSSIIKNIN